MRSIRSIAVLGLLSSVLWLSPGCASRGHIQSGDTKVHGLPNAGKPATLETSNEGETLELHPGDRVEITHTDPVPARPATATQPAIEAKPATETTVIYFGSTTNWRRNKATVKADTGTIDTSVAKHKIDVESRQWLLWAALACGIGGVVLRSMLPAWGGLSNGLLVGAALAFAAWIFAEIPAWAFIVVIVLMGAMAMGYKRAEWDKNGDGIPDALQRKDQS